MAGLTTDTPDRGPSTHAPGYASRGLGIPKSTAHGLLGIPRPLRASLLAELARVDPVDALTWLRLRPDVDPV